MTYKCGFCGQDFTNLADYARCVSNCSDKAEAKKAEDASKLKREERLKRIAFLEEKCMKFEDNIRKLKEEYYKNHEEWEKLVTEEYETNPESMRVGLYDFSKLLNDVTLKCKNFRWPYGA